MLRILAESRQTVRAAAIGVFIVVCASCSTVTSAEPGNWLRLRQPATPDLADSWTPLADTMPSADSGPWIVASLPTVETVAPTLQPEDPLTQFDAEPRREYLFTSNSLNDTEPTTPQTAAPSTSSAAGANQTYGKEQPRPVVRRQFLRTQSPLLPPGDWQFDVGVAYTMFQYDFPSIDSTGALVRGDLRRQTLVCPFAFRYGLSKKTQLYVNVPVGWRNTELASSPLTTTQPTDTGSNYGGLGDIQLGATHLLRQGSDGIPDVVVSVNAGLPTGEKSLLTNVFSGGLGTGYGSLGGQVLLIHTYDPIVVFWGVGYNHYFPGQVQGQGIQLGDQFLFQLGSGFAVNERVTLSTAFLGGYVTQTRLSGDLVPNTQQQPMRTRFAATVSRKGKIIEPFVEIGMTYTSPAARTGVTWTF